MLMEPQHEFDDGKFNYQINVELSSWWLKDKAYSQIRFLEKFYQKIFCETITTSRHIGGTGNHNKLTTNQNIVNDSLKWLSYHK